MDNQQDKGKTPDNLEPIIASPSRRRLLTNLTLAGGGVALGAFGAFSALKNNQAPDVTTACAHLCDDPSLQSVPFFGQHQSGIITPETAEAIFISFNVVGRTKNDLVTLFKGLTQRIAFLTKGGPQPTEHIQMPPPDSGLLGTQIHPDNLSITVAVGASLFDERFGLHTLKPKQLVEMPSFSNDALDASWCDGDILLQICANSRETVIYAMRDIIKNFPKLLVPHWKMDGFLPARAIRHRSTPINLFGFKDGTGNPSTKSEKLMNEMVWVNKQTGEPDWTEGGTYQVIRLIRHYLEFWDRTPLGEQQVDFGRQKASGAPFGKENEFDDPEYESDPEGKITPLDSHMRRAEPRGQGRHDAKLLRRSYNYSLGLTKSSQLDMGLVFVCFQSDLQKGFIDTQNRLSGEPLEEYIKPFGGGYYFALPGIQEGSWLGQSLLEA
ncbi:iron uptake transporter deferrochelatase/peroxidase subunit [Neisseria sp. Ec49-e6-T10]|uniref:iron uptake transporter deferrochelatase/peroxidase subunit n=1 Tax=Neisseria sp. Ec49-e6-T10 TaxID=3140744 RepID=UPI003EBB853D